MKALTATCAAVVLALSSIAGTAKADEWKMDALSHQVSVLPEALGLQDTDRREFLCLALAIYHEARGEPTTGKEAVAHVVYNRTQSRAFPATICGVVWQKGQFGWTPRPVGSLVPRDPEAWLEAQRIAYGVIKHRGSDPTRGATYFYGAHERHKPRWAYKAEFASRLGGHIFCSVPGLRRTTEVIQQAAQDVIGDLIEKVSAPSVASISINRVE